MEKITQEKEALIEMMKSSKSQFEAMFADVQQYLQKEITEKNEENEGLIERIECLEKTNHQKIDELESRLTQKGRIVEPLQTELAALRTAEQEELNNYTKLKEQYDELKKAETMWLAEKDMLIERCLGNESDIEYEKSLKKIKDSWMKPFQLCTNWDELINLFS